MRHETKRIPPATIAVVSTLALLLAGAGSACASGDVPPSVEAESVSGIKPTDATLEARINPGDADAGVYYQFQIANDLGEYVSEIVCPPEPSAGPAHPCVGAHSSDALPIGFVEPGSGPTSVSLDLASAGVALHPATTYQYRVLAAKAVLSEDTIEWEAPAIVGPVQSFTTGSPDPPIGIAPAAIDGGGSAPAIQSFSRHHRRHHRRYRKRARRLRSIQVSRAVLIG